MARSTTRQKNFGMAKAVKRNSPTQNANKSKAKQTKNKPQTTTAVHNQKSNSMPKTRSTQSILKRELAQKANTTANQRTATKNDAAGSPKTSPKAAKSVNTPNSLEKIVCGQANVKTDELLKPKEEPTSFNSSGRKSPSMVSKISIKVYEALDYPQKKQSPDSTVLSSDLKKNTYDDVVISSSGDHECQRSPDLFDSDSMDGHANNSSDTEQHQQKVKIEMVSAGVQCDLQLENRTDVGVGTDDIRVKMIDVGTQTSPLPSVYQCATCQTNASYGSMVGFTQGESVFVNYDDSDELDDQYDDEYESDSSYDHCLDEFDCLEHLDGDDGGGNAYQNMTNNNNVMNQHDDRPKMDQNEPVIAESPPRVQVYKNRRFHSPDSLGSKTNKNKL